MNINGREFSELQNYMENYEHYLEGLLSDFEKYEMNSLIHPKLQREHLSDRNSIISKRGSFIVLTDNHKFNWDGIVGKERTFNNISELKSYLLTKEYKNMAVHLETTRQKIVSFVAGLSENKAKEILAIGDLNNIYDELKTDITKTPVKLLNYAKKVLGDDFSNHAEDILHQIRNSGVCNSDKVVAFLDKNFDNKIGFHSIDDIKTDTKSLKEAVYKSFNLEKDGAFKPAIKEKINNYIQNADILRPDGLTDKDIAKLKAEGKIKPRSAENKISFY